MRDDNGVDYTWLCFSLSTLIDAWLEARAAHAAEAEAAIAETIANGLSTDAGAFLDARTPSVLAGCDVERRGFRERVGDHVTALTDAFAPYRPRRRRLQSARAVLQLLSERAQGRRRRRVALGRSPTNFTERSVHEPAARSDSDQRKLRLLHTLMGFARANPDRIRGRLMPVIVYDVVAGRRAFGAMTRAIQGAFRGEARLTPSGADPIRWTGHVQRD